MASSTLKIFEIVESDILTMELSENLITVDVIPIESEKLHRVMVAFA